MEIRGAEGDLDLGERERRRLQDYEDIVDQHYDPFHENCRRNAFLSHKKLIATRIIGWRNGVVFSAKPIPLGGTFQVKLLEAVGYPFGTLVSAQSNLSHTLYV